MSSYEYPLVNFNLNTKKKENMALFLIGGPSKHYYWDSKIVLEQIKNISKKFKFKKLLITTSRRTPIDFIDEFNRLKIRNIKLYEYTKIQMIGLIKILLGQRIYGLQMIHIQCL